MARSKNRKNGQLEEAMRNMLLSQAAFVQNQAAFQAQLSEMNRINADRFARIEAILLEHSRILNEHSRVLADHSRILADHSRILEALPDAVQRKIGFGFQPPEQP